MATIPYSQAQTVLVAHIQDLDTSGTVDAGRIDFIAPYNCRIRWCCAQATDAPNAEVTLRARGNDQQDFDILVIPNATAATVVSQAEVGPGATYNSYRTGHVIGVRSDGAGSAGGLTTVMLIVEPN